jgi:hypothetical protein
MTLAEQAMQQLGGSEPDNLTKLARKVKLLDPLMQRDQDGNDHYIHFTDGSILGVRYKNTSPNGENQLWIPGGVGTQESD